MAQYPDQPERSSEPEAGGEESNPCWREPPPPPDIPELLTTPVDHPAAKAPEVHDSGLSETSKAWAIAMDFVFTIIGAMILGYLADRWQHTIPRYTFVGLASGMVLALYRFIRRTLAEERKEKERRNRPR